MNVIVTCKCGNTDEFATNAFHLLFPDKELPEMISGRIAVRSYADHLTDEYKKMVQALVDSFEPFAYYFSDDGVWDLMMGQRVC